MTTIVITIPIVVTVNIISTATAHDECQLNIYLHTCFFNCTTAATTALVKHIIVNLCIARPCPPKTSHFMMEEIEPLLLFRRTHAAKERDRLIRIPTARFVTAWSGDGLFEGCVAISGSEARVSGQISH